MRSSRPRSSPRATRWLPADEIHAELARLGVVVDKTAGPRERAAMDRVLAQVRAAIGDG